MKKRLLTAWIIACMFICLVGQTPITALADGDDTRVISVPEGLQNVLINETPETQTAETEIIKEESTDVQTQQNDENNNDVQSEQGEATGETDAQNQTVGEDETSATQNEVIDETNDASTDQNEAVGETNEASTEQNETAGETNESQKTQSEDAANTSDAQVEQTEKTVTADETPAAQNETATETPAQNQPVQGANAISETVECVERSVEALLPEGTHNHGDIVRVSGLLPKDAIVEAIPVDVEIEGQIVLLAYDITIYENEEKKNAGICWQPEEGGLNVEFISSALEKSEEEVNIWHMEDSEQDPEYVTAAPSSDDSVEFTAESFSVYVVTETKLTATIIASDGNTYEINVTYDNKAGIPMEGTALKVDELKPGDDGYDEYIEESASKVGANAEDLEFSKVFDIKIVDENDENTVYEPTGNVDVSIRVIGVSLSEYPQVNVLHFVEQRNAESRLVYDVESTINEDKVEFTTDSFSVYVVLSAPEPPPTPSIQKVQDLNELAGNYSNAAGFFLSYGSNIYFTNSLNGNSAFVETTSINNASHWFLEAVPGQANRYYIYTEISGVTKYMYNTSGNLMGLSETNKTAFEFECPSGTTELFTLKVVGANKWLQHSGSGGGIRLYTDKNNSTNSRISLTYASFASIQDDYYEFDGKTYSIAFYEEGVSGAGLTSETFSNNSSKLKAIELLVRPDVLNSTGELLIAQGTDLTDWKFTCIEGASYYITTKIGGVDYYLTLGNGISLLTTPTDNSKITVESGTGERKGKLKFSSNGKSLALSNGKVANGFVSASDGKNDWLNLVSKSPLLDDDDFAVYSAEKVDLSDRTMVPDGAKVVLYTRKWNDETKKYEYYAVNYDGSLVRAFESGALIQWVGSTVNTMTWEFTEYTDSNGDPNYYYQLKNTYPGGAASNCIRPAQDSTFLRTESAYPNYFDRSINLNGRRYGYYYSTILAWDDPSYAFVGLKVKDDCSGIEVCSMDEADAFYFAIVTDTDPTVEDPTTVETIDHKQYGITMKMVNFPGPNQNVHKGMTQFLEGKDGTNTALNQGLLSTDLKSDGYPKSNANGESLYNLFSQVTGDGALREVNNLFIKNTYYSSGYYEFDSTQNFASFYKEDGSYDPDNFTVYNELGTNDLKGTESMKHGQFLPYNKLTNQYAVINPENLYNAQLQELPDSDPRKYEKLRLVNSPTIYHYAVEIEASFTQTANGLDAWGHDIIYEFTGDDDFWLYVDGELIIDLGGVHSALAGSVNYSTGDVYVNGVHKTLRQIFEENYRSRKGYANRSTASSEENEEVDAYLANFFDGDETIFKDYSDHTMRIFYMERGAGASNLHMRFNLASVKPGTVLLSKEIVGVDSTESFMSEYPFQIYYKGKDEDPEELMHPGVVGTGISVVYKDTNRTVAYRPTYTAPGDSVVYENVFMLKPGETAEIDFPDNGILYKIVECAVDITELDNSTTPPETTHQGIYEKVEVNGVEVTGQPNGGGNYRQDFSTSWNEVSKQGRVTFYNHVDANAKGTLTFQKKLYDETGTTPIPHEDNDTTFTFRLYLGTENTSDSELALADMCSYHVKDDTGKYCYWDASEGKLKPLSSGKTSYDDLTAAEKRQATFTTSMNGSIANIPVDYTVEVREIPAGTKYKVEEREYELPDGYSLLWYVTKINTSGTWEETQSKKPASGVINVVSEYNEITIKNMKGWGLRCYKDWSDATWMETRDAIYMAVYRDNNGTLELVESIDSKSFNPVRRVTRDEDSAYWFFEIIEDLNSDGYKNETDFAKYVIREVTISNVNPSVDAMGRVSDYGTVIIKDVGDTISLNGKQYGDNADSSLTYTVTEYEEGSLTDHSNVRKDRITNKRAGVDLYVTKWDGTTPLSGASFEFKDGSGNSVTGSPLKSDTDGLITIAYLRNDEVYTLTETKSPAGFIGLQKTLYIKRNGNDVYVSEDNSTWNQTITNDADAWYYADDTDVNAGSDIRIGKITIKNKPYTLKIKKTQQTKDGEALEGAIFALYQQVTGNDGQPRKDFQPISGYDNLITGNDGLVPNITDDFEDGTLIPGTYYLHEVYPVTGYQPLSEDVVFNVSQTGIVTLGSCPDGVELDEDTNIIYVPNQLEGTTVLTVKKTVEKGTISDTDGTHKFNFTATVYLPDGHTPWKYSDVDGNFDEGVASFVLSHNGTKELTVPIGAVVKVKEAPEPSISDFYDIAASMAETNQGETTTSTFEYGATNFESTVTVKDDTNITLTYTNTRKTVTVTVKKSVEGSGRDFNFTALLKDGSILCPGWTLNDSGTTVDTSDDILTDANGEGTFILSPQRNSTVQIVLTIPYGASLTVTEDQYQNYTTKVGSSSGNVWTKANITSNQSVTFTNKEIFPAPTNYTTNYKPFFMMFGFGAILIGLIVPTVVMVKRRKEEEE